MGGGSLREAPPSLPGRTRGTGGKTKGSGQGGTRALASPANPAIVSLGASERMEADAWAAQPAGEDGVGPKPLFCMDPQGRCSGEPCPVGGSQGQ